MAVDIKDYVYGCRECQQYKARNYRPPGLKDPTEVPMVPASCWALDFIGPLPMSRKRSRYALVCIDMCTRWIVTSPARSNTSQHVVKALDMITTQYGKPSLLVADNGQHFVSNQLKDYCEDRQIVLHNIPKYSPKTNVTERHIRTLKTAISIFAKGDHRNWDENLPYVTLGLNTSVSEITKYTPAKLMYGRELNSVFSVFNDAKDGNLTEFDPEDYAESVEYDLAKIYKRVLDATEQAKASQARQYNIRRQEKFYRVDDLVWRRNFPQSRKVDFIAAKLQPKYIGPCRIAKVCSRNQYQLMTLGGKDMGLWDIEHLKPFI